MKYLIIIALVVALLALPAIAQEEEADGGFNLFAYLASLADEPLPWLSNDDCVVTLAEALSGASTCAPSEFEQTVITPHVAPQPQAQPQTDYSAIFGGGVTSNPFAGF